MCPMYEFSCEECGEILEKIVPLNTHEVICECGGIASKIISLSSFKISGYTEANGYSDSKDCNKAKGG